MVEWTVERLVAHSAAPKVYCSAARWAAWRVDSKVAQKAVPKARHSVVLRVEYSVVR